MGRKGWILVGLLLVAIPAADAIWWRIAIGRVETGFNAWAARARSAGWTVTNGRMTPHGWPWTATVEIADVAISGGADYAPSGLSWHAPNVSLRVPLMRPTSLDIEATGEQRIRIGSLPETVLTASHLLAVYSIVAAEQARGLEFLADRPQWRAVGDTDSANALTATRVRVQLQIPGDAQANDAGTAFALSAEEISLPSAIRWPLGRSVAALAADGVVAGRIPRIQAPVPWATAWRDGGGSVQLQRVSADWGPLHVSGSATLALDDQLQPMGAGISHLAGYGATLDALAAGGTLSRSAATAAKAVLSLLANAPADDEAADVEVPLTLQYRTLSMRQVPLVRLPEIDWPEQ